MHKEEKSSSVVQALLKHIFQERKFLLLSLLIMAFLVEMISKQRQFGIN